MLDIYSERVLKAQISKFVVTSSQHPSRQEPTATTRMDLILRLRTSISERSPAHWMKMVMATLHAPIQSDSKGLPGMATVVASVDVMESGSGRSTKRTSRLKVHPTETYLGLQIGIDVDELRPNVEYPVSGIVVDWKGNRKKTLAAVEVQVSEIDYSYNWTYNEDSNRYEMSTKRFELPLRKETVPGKSRSLLLNVRGDRDIEEYRIRAQAGPSVTFLDLSRSYDYWYSRSRVQTPDPFRPDNDIRTPSSMNLRETVTATTVAPYPGKYCGLLKTTESFAKSGWMLKRLVKSTGSSHWLDNHSKIRST